MYGASSTAVSIDIRGNEALLSQVSFIIDFTASELLSFTGDIPAKFAAFFQ